MDIERLNKIKQICFNKKQSNNTRKHQPLQVSRSPLSRMPAQEKENQNTTQIQPRSKLQKKDHLKQFEKEITKHYERKSLALEENIKKFNESLKQRHERKNMQLTLDIQAARSQSPLRNDRDLSHANFKHFGSPILRSNSSVKLIGKNQNVIQLLPSQYIKGRSPYQQNYYEGFSNSFCETSQFGINEDDQINYFKIENLESDQIRKTKQILNTLLNTVAQPQSNPIMQHKAVEEMRLRLNGAFDKLIRLNFQEQNQFIGNVIQGFLNDLSQRLIAMNNSQHTSDSQIQGLKRIINEINNQITMMDLEAIMNHVLDYAKQIKLEQAFDKISNILKRNKLKAFQKYFKQMQNDINLSRQQESTIKNVIERYLRKFQYSSSAKSFNIWKQQSIQRNHIIENEILQRYGYYVKDSISQSQSFTRFDISTKAFVRQCLPQVKNLNIDIFYHKNNELYALKQDASDDNNDHNKILVNDQKSIVYQFKNKKVKYEYIANVIQKKNFIQEFDLPIIVQRDQYLKETQQIQQLLWPIYYQKSASEDKKLTIIIRLTYQNMEPLDKEMLLMDILLRLKKMSQLILNLYKSFSKIYRMLKGFNNKINGNINAKDQYLSDKVLNQLSYLQQKSLELSCFQHTSDCFKFISTLVKEIFNYDKCHILQYNQGSIQKLYDNSKNQQSMIGYSEDTKSQQLILEMIKESIENGGQSFNESNKQWGQIKQEIKEEEDRFEMNRKQIKDIVVMGLDQPSQNIDVSSQLAMSSIQQSFTMHLNSKFFLRMEKRLDKSKDQEQFQKKYEQSNILLKNFNQLVMIAIAKMKIIMIQREQQEIDQSRLIKHENDLEFTKISQANEELRKLVELQKQIDIFTEDLKSNKSIKCFDELQKKLCNFIGNYIPSAKRMQLFLAKDEIGTQWYTYIQEQVQQQQIQKAPKLQNVLPSNFNTSSFQCTSKLQSTLPYQPQLFNGENQQQYQAQISNSNGTPGKLIRVKNVQIRPQSQVNQVFNQQHPFGHQHHHQHQMTYHLDDISSISGCDANTNNQMDKNSMLINTFIADNNQIPQLQQHKRQGSLTRQPSINLYASSSSSNLRNQIHMIQRQQQLKRDNSALSEQFIIQQVPQKITEQSEGNLMSSDRIHRLMMPTVKQNINEDSMITSQIIQENQIDNDDDFEIVTQNSSSRKVEFTVQIDRPNEIRSLIGYSIYKHTPLIKRNMKNDKRFNQYLDNLIMNAEEKKVIAENGLFIPIVTSKSIVIGLIQLANTDKNLPFTDQDSEIMKIIANKFGQYLQESKVQFSYKQLFQKQLEVSMMYSSLENQSVTKILTLANKLFQQKQEPIKSVATFIQKTERYLRQIFSCKYSQFIIVDYDQEILSTFDNDKPILVKRCEFTDESIAVALVRNQIQDPIMWPLTGGHNDYILIGDGETPDKSNSTPHNNGGTIASHLFNADIDCPQKSLDYAPNTYLAVSIREDHQDGRVLAIIQLMVRLNGFKFVESDAKHLTMLCDHLSQVFTYIQQENYLKPQLSPDQQQKLTRLTKILQKKQKSYYKHFFRELLQFKYGKVNLLKNKILRKFLNRYVKANDILSERIQKLIEFRKKYEIQTKTQGFQKLKQKIKLLNDKRNKNALKCMQIINKYDRILSIRVKDTVFKFWEQIKKQDLSQIAYYGENQKIYSASEDQNEVDLKMLSRELMQNNPQVQNQSRQMTHFQSTFNINQDQCTQQQYIEQQNYLSNNLSCLNDNTIMNQSSFLDESSVTSTLYLKAKAVYKFRKLFNRHNLKLQFDTFTLKVFCNSSRKFLTNSHFFNDDLSRLITLHQILKKKVIPMEQKFFNAFKENHDQIKKKEIILKKVIEKSKSRFLTFGIRTWQNQSDLSIRQELKQERNNNSMLTEQCKESSMLQYVIQGLNKTLTQQEYKSIDSCLNANEIRSIFSQLCEQLTGFSLQQYSVVLTFQLPSNYHLKGQYFAYFLYQCQDQGFMTKTAFHQQLSNLSSIIEISRAEKHLNNQVYDKQNHFSSISEVANLNTNQQTDQIYQPRYDSQPFESHFFISDASEDYILRSLSQTKSPIIFSKLQDEKLIQTSLYQRKMVDQSQAFIIPILNKQQQGIFGTIEIYQRTQFESTQFFVEDQNRFKQSAHVIQLILETMAQRLSLIQTNDLLNLEKEQESQKSYYKERSLSNTVQDLSLKVQKAYSADHCILIFIPFEKHTNSQSKGTFYNFKNNKLYSIDFQGTFLYDLLQNSNNQDVRQVTFPSSLVCPKIQTSDSMQQTKQSPLPFEKFETLTAQQDQFEALKYIPITFQKRGGQSLLVILEIGWNQIDNAQKEHDNQYALFKKEGIIKDQVRDQIEAINRNIKLFSFMMENQFKQQQIFILKEYFQKWLKQIAEDIVKRRQQIYQTSVKKQVRYTYDHNSRVEDQRFHTEKRRISFATQNAHYDQSHSPSRQSAAQLSNFYFQQSNLTLQDPTATKGHQRRVSNITNTLAEQHQQEHEEYHSELEVERAAKRKLVSSALLFVALLQRTQRLSEIRIAFNDWKAFLLQTQLAERAFNQLLEINHKHSKVRYETAVNMMERVCKKDQLRNVMAQLKVFGITGQEIYQAYKAGQEQARGYNLKIRSSYDQLTNNHLMSNDGANISILSRGFGGVSRVSAGVGSDTQMFEDEVFSLQELAQEHQAMRQRERLSQERRSRQESYQPQYIQQQHNNQRNMTITDDYSQEAESEFSLGTGTCNMIKFKADSILEQARSQFKHSHLSQHQQHQYR